MNGTKIIAREGRSATTANNKHGETPRQIVVWCIAQNAATHPGLLHPFSREHLKAN